MRSVAGAESRYEAEGAFFLLRVVQSEHGVEPVEQASEFDDVLGLDGLVVEAGEKPAEAAHLVLDLGVRAAHRRGRVRAAECSGDEGHEECFVGPLVWEQFGLEPFEQGAGRGEVSVAGGQRVGHGSDLLDDRQQWRRARPGVAGAVATSAGGIAIVWTAPGSTARSAMPMASTSMTSCRSAPAAGGRSPAAAATIAASDSPMPTRTACSAIRFERRAMKMASARASIRSTVSTTSAASDDAVAPRAASATPDAGGGERGSVVDAVADHDRRAVRGLGLDRGELVGRVAVGQHGVDADDPPDHVGDVGAVAGDQDHRGDPGVAQGPHHPGRVGPDRVLEQEGARGLVVDRAEYGQRAVQVGAPAHLARPRRLVLADDPRRLAEPDRWPPTRPSTP